MASASAATAAKKEARLPAGARISGGGMSTSDLFIFTFLIQIEILIMLRFASTIKFKKRGFSNHGITRRITENIRNGFYLKKPKVDRINRINRIFFERFPEENAQTLSPSAKLSIINHQFGKKHLFVKMGDY